ncbi:MAG: FprA family A-type flavoprotein [Candidatus Cryptobacteroides sp.]
MNSKYISYIGVDDTEIDLFESQYVVPAGMCYNSYLVKGSRIAVMDTVDARKSGEWLGKLAAALGGKKPDFLVVQHMEPDHSGSVAAFLKEYPGTTVICSAQAATFLLQFNPGLDAEVKPFEGTDGLAGGTWQGSSRVCIRTVKEGDCLDLGEDVVLHFIAAPMVHWPEVIMTWMPAGKTLFSADGFGNFGVYDADPDEWACEARRYYFNICGKYGAQVAKVLQKASGLDIQRICPLHGPVLTGERMEEAFRLYTIWSSYEPETPEGILIAHASIHGNTAAAARRLADILKAKGAPKVAVTDLCRDDVAEAVEDAFRMGTMVLACSTYDGGLFPPMQGFLNKLAIKGFCKRRVALVENGTWAPQTGRLMKTALESMASIDILEGIVTLRSTLKESQVAELEAFADRLLDR